MTPSFDRVPIADVARAVFGELLGRNVDRLDLGERAAGQVIVYPVQNRRAADLATLPAEAPGGLITSPRGRGRGGIKVLSSIPVVGAAFGSTETTADRTELLLVIRPVVVRSHGEARLADEERRAFERVFSAAGGPRP